MEEMGPGEIAFPRQGAGKESGRAQTPSDGSIPPQPPRLDVQGEYHRPGGARPVFVVMRLPRVDEDGTAVGKQMQAISHREKGVGTACLDQKVAARVRVGHQ